MKIGVFDSGMGGLSVLHCARKLLPKADFIYYADEEHVPYGEKEPEQIRRYIEDIFDFLLQREVDAIVIACNTATTMADRDYRSQFSVPIVGMEPAVKKAVDLYGEEQKRILVAATPVTIRGHKLQDLVEQVDRYHEADLIAMPGLVRYAEAGGFETEEVLEYLRRELAFFDLERYGTIVLGCTHFNYFKRCFQKIFGQKIHFTDGNEGTIRQLIRLLPSHCPEGQGQVEYYVSGRPADLVQEQMIEVCMDQLDQVFEV